MRGPLDGEAFRLRPLWQAKGWEVRYATQSSVAVAQAARLLCADVRARRPERSMT